MTYDRRAQYRVETHRDDSGWTAKLPDLGCPPLWARTPDELEQRVRMLVRNHIRGGDDEFDLQVRKTCGPHLY